MIETETLIQWAHKLAEFVNGHAEPHPLFTAADFDAEDHEAHRLPTEPRTPKQLAALRERAQKCLVALAKTKRPKGVVDAELARLAQRWLDEDPVRSAHPAHALTPMDGAFSLSESGQLQVAHANFRSIDAQFAVTFAELIQPAPKGKKKKGPPLIKRCKVCQDFFVQPPLRQHPWAHCPRHRLEIKQTHQKPEGETK